MYRVKCSKWPNVLPDDNGIRPAGRSDECFYCNQKVGQPHGERCVTVSSWTLWDVKCNDVSVGSYFMYKPYGLSNNWHFHMNESSWCSDNALDRIIWNGEVPKEVREIAKDPDRCTCGILSFELIQVVDEGPFIEVH